MADLTITKPNDELWDGVNSVRRWANRWMSCESQDRTLILEAITDGLASVLEGQPFDVAHANRFYLNCPGSVTVMPAWITARTASPTAMPLTCPLNR